MADPTESTAKKLTDIAEQERKKNLVKKYKFIFKLLVTWTFIKF